MLLARFARSVGAEEIGVELSGAKDGVNTTFTTPNDFESSTLKLYINGLLQKLGPTCDYTVTGTNSVQIAFPLIATDNITADYVPA